MTMLRCGHEIMNRLLAAFFLSLTAVTGAVAAPTPVPFIFINTDPLTPPDLPPQVDATIFWNRSLFIVSNNFLFPPFPTFSEPYEAQSVRFWTNNGVMLGLPGFRFNYTPNPAHLTRRERR